MTMSAAAAAVVAVAMTSWWFPWSGYMPRLTQPSSLLKPVEGFPPVATPPPQLVERGRSVYFIEVGVLQYELSFSGTSVA